MSTTTESPALTRPSSAIAADIAQKLSRQAALEKRLEEAGTELELLRAQQGRALADGTEGPKATELQALAETRDGLRRALGVLADDLKQLEEESKVAATAEAELYERECIDVAAKLVDQLEALIRELAEKQLLPCDDRLAVALKAAREAERAHDRLRGASPPGSRVDRRVYGRHTKTFTLMTIIRAYMAGKTLPIGDAFVSAPAPRGEQQTSSLAMK
jgi:hypothetical protein